MTTLASCTLCGEIGHDRKACRHSARAPAQPSAEPTTTSSTDVPPRPETVVRLVVLSDTHGNHWDLPQLPEGDVLIHLGDIADKGRLEHLQSFATWLKSQDGFVEKLVIEGNHDRDLAAPDRVSLARELADCARVLRDETVVIADGRLRVHGASWSTCENDDFSRTVAAADVPPPHVLLTHSPPAGAAGAHGGGSSELLQLVERMRIPLHLFGHVHAGRGVDRRSCCQGSLQGTTMVNCATNRVGPVVIDLDVSDGDAVGVRVVHCMRYPMQGRAARLER